MNTTYKPIIVEQTFNASIEEIWAAITEVDQMTKWFFDNIPSFEPIEGFETRFSVQSEGRNFEHIWKIIEVEPIKKIKYHWSYEEYSGEGLVTFELFEVDQQTLLRLTNEGIESFPQDMPEFTRESCEGGWNYFIKQNLKDYLG